MKKVSLIATAVAASLAAGSAFAVDFNGYVRSGVGLSGDAGENIGFEKSKVGRLGNENDTFFEVGLGQELYNEDGVSFYLDSLIAHAVDGNNDWEASDSALRVINIQAKGLIASDKDAVVWTGKRYYQRRDVHITDFYYLNTSSGAGAGIENLSVGGGKLSTAIIMDAGKQDSGTATYDWVDADSDASTTPVWQQTGYATEDVDAYTLDIRYAGINLWEDASLELAGAYNFANEKKGQKAVADDGALLTAIMQQGMDSGFNQTVLQYGTSSYAAQMPGLGGGNNFDRSGVNNDGKGFRVLNWGVVGLGDSWEVGHQVMFASASDIGENKWDQASQAYSGVKTFDHTLANVVVRPAYKWNKIMKTVAEVGYYTEEKDNVDAAGSKFTLAQTWSAGSSFWARPEIRVYGSYFMDHEGEGFSGDDSEFSAGVQFEAWW
ncbi:maltoporin LamB [Vibrio makurazakiensis]|uniref:maltoporin LamB n=1 Tax=Vibrio makurazakiensis TaxID=2910250 RepID=UPI003D144298